MLGPRDMPPHDVLQNVAQSGNPIVTVMVAGGVCAQGQTVRPMDPRGFHLTDMHGKLAIDIGGQIVVGTPIPSVRR